MEHGLPMVIGTTARDPAGALELIGVHPTALYPGSWSAWSADPTRAVAVGEQPLGRPSTDTEHLGKGVDA
jgi:thiosulfate/3-mercaptopyruvate sulfurtransferase